MSNDKSLVKTNESLDKVLMLWNDQAKLSEIRKIYAPKLSDGEFKAFVETGIACKLNPFLREIWAIKYDQNTPAQIFIGRDGYRKILSRNPAFEGIITESVCENDDFNVDIVKGEVKHIPNIKNRGKLIGAYCIIYMRGVKIPYYVFVTLEEYNTGRSVWKDKPHTMIKKVAECQCIRMADQTCASTYSSEEMPEDKLVDYSSKSDELNRKYNLYDGETGEIKEDKAIEVKEVKNDVIIEECPFTFDQVRNGMLESNSLQILNDFASVISQMTITKDQRSELTKIYRDKIKELKKDVVNNE